MPTPPASADPAVPASSKESSSSSSASRRDACNSVLNPLEPWTLGTPTEADAMLLSGAASPSTPPLIALPSASHHADLSSTPSFALPTTQSSRVLSQRAAAAPLPPPPSPLPQSEPRSSSSTTQQGAAVAAVASAGPAAAPTYLGEGLLPATGDARFSDAQDPAPAPARPGRAPVAELGGTPLREVRARASLGRPARSQQEDEELTQLARSLRSEIVGEPFWLTAAFSPTTRGPRSGAHSPAALSSASVGGSAVDSATGASGGHRRLRKLQQEAGGTHSSTEAAAAATASVAHPTVPVSAASVSPATAAPGAGSAPATSPKLPRSSWGPPLKAVNEASLSAPGCQLSDPQLLQALSPVGQCSGEGRDGGWMLPLSLAELREASADDERQNCTQTAGDCDGSNRDSSAGAAQCPAHTAESPLRASAALPGRGVDDDVVNVGDLHSVEELRRRLATEDFFSSPFRKFLRDGTVPWKLITSLGLCVLLLLQVMWYQLPLARANALMRRAMTTQFMGDDFESKGHGDIVSAPTAWMEDLYASVEHYVGVYYNLSNTSSSSASYYASPLECRYGSAAAAPSWCGEGNASAAVRERTLTALPTIPVSSVAPVRMQVKVDVFSRREGVQHSSTSPYSSLAALRRSRLWGWVGSATSSAGRDGREEAEGSGARWLTFFVDAEHPLGPFAKYRDAARRFHKRDKGLAKGTREDRAANAKKATRTGEMPVGSTESALPSAGGVKAVLAVVCAPRLDELTGRYYRPCSSVPPRLSGTEAATPGAAVDDTSPSTSSLFPEYSLIDNVRAIHLDVTLRHEISDGGSTLGGPTFSVSAEASKGRGSLLRQHSLQGVAGGTAEEGAAVFQWHVEKVIEIHPGGLVETQLHVNTRTWPKEASIRQLWWPSHWMIALLDVLAVLEVALRVRALWRIRQYKNRLCKERAAFHARQMREQGLLHRQRGAAGGGEVRRCDDPTTRSPRSVTVATAAAPCEWGFPGTPAMRCPPDGSEVAVPLLLPGPARADYGTMTLATAVGEASTHVLIGDTQDADGCEDKAGGTRCGARARPSSAPPSPAAAAREFPVYSKSTPLPVQDTSLNILASPSLAAVGADRAVGFAGRAEGGGGAGVRTPTPAASARTPVASWFGRRLLRAFLSPARCMQPVSRDSATPDEAERSKDSLDKLASSLHLFSPHCAEPQRSAGYSDTGGVAGQDSLVRGAAAPIPLSGVPRATFRTPFLGVSPLTPQRTVLIMERSYVSLRSTWRHHLQQSMGAGWHCIGIISAVLTLSYSALLLAPLLPRVGVAQDARYDAWTSILLGTAALTSCVLLLSDLRFSPTLYFPILASTYVLPKLLLFALCVSPLFFGFVIFFRVAFGPYSEGHFDSLGWASMGLYLMTYGDSLLDTISVISDARFVVTVLVAKTMVIVFVLLFMMIMLHIAMTITQHEWLRLRRRFGAAFSSSNLLFSVRSRAQVKAEAVEAARTNLEVLWFMLSEEEEAKKQSAQVQA
ncbi:hypothetical protein ABL78_2992 [Leptomonas seymouri]|uniref:Polycystin cation channel PKD1/PKD2 domain-containing protein n=1 Tax=Leptomonas seymouri TaxID=5684 RepID=A0A0N1I8G5_LEPSE|nr:hypothetical protein ABL78_2992 [Leptomonas seymouri]|eukprot:KPI87914.1 hypothetical protein ABL78_2992 [Leptomonas seymouri]